MDAEDVRLRCPGDSSWATELEGKEELERWLQRVYEDTQKSKKLDECLAGAGKL